MVSRNTTQSVQEPSPLGIFATRTATAAAASLDVAAQDTAASSPRHSTQATDYGKESPRGRRRSSSASMQRTVRVLGVHRLFDGRSIQNRSRSGSELSAGSSSQYSGLTTPASSAHEHGPLFRADFHFGERLTTHAMLPLPRPSRCVPPPAGHIYGIANPSALDVIDDTPPRSPELSAHSLRRRSSEMLRALRVKTQEALERVPSAASLTSKVRRRPSELSLAQKAEAPAAQRPMLHATRSMELLWARFNPMQLFAGSSDSLTVSHMPAAGFSRTALSQGSVTQIHRLLRDTQLLPAFFVTVRTTPFGVAAALSDTLRAALRDDARIKDAADGGLLALYDAIYAPRADLKQDEYTQGQLQTRNDYRRTMWYGPHDEQRSQLMAQQMRISAYKFGLERLLSAFVYLLEPAGGPEVQARIDLGSPSPLSVEEWQSLFAPWGAWLTPEALANTHSMRRRTEAQAL